ncbi:ROK family protein [Nakamurella sp.]|uniref:ROK family transcriptional regulator n=1 Tax=Nakamurella sp. TaxID=1869182 RepID=UPI003782F722
MPIAVRSSAGSTPADQATVRRLNLSLLLNNLAAGGARSRARLADDTGLTKATVSSLVAELIDRGLVMEGPVERSGLGRPGRAVELDPGGVRFLGIELQVDYIAGMVLDLRGTVLARQRLGRSMAELGPARALGEVADLARALVAEAGSRVDQVQSLHLAIPGLIDADAGMLALAPNLHWRDIDIVHTLMGRLQWNDARIGVDNDANMGAIAHHAVGDASRSQNLVYLAGAVGVGAGMIVDGRIVRGAAGFAGEVGHIAVGSPDRLCGCGRRGCWETSVSLSALLDSLAEPDESPSDHPSDLGARLGQVNRRAAGGERRVLDAIDEQAHWLGIGMSALANILNPDTFVLGGHFSVLRDYYREPVLSELRSRLLAGSVSRVEFSDLEFEAASLGAAHAGIAQLIADPTLARIRKAG